MISRKAVFGGLIAVAALTVLAWNWLLHTESGAHFLWNRASAATGGALNAKTLNGDLASGLRIEGLNYRNDSIDVAVNSVTIVVDIDVMPPAIEVTELRGNDIRLGLTIDGGESDAPTDIRSLLENLNLPLQLSSPDLLLKDISISGLLDQQDLIVDEVRLSVTWKDEIHIDALEIVSPEASATLSGSIDLSRPFAVSLAAKTELQPVLTGQESPVLVDGEFGGSLDELSASLIAAQLGAELNAHLYNVLELPTWDARLSATVEEFGLQPMRVFIAADGDTAAAQVSSLSVDGIDIIATGSGLVRWSDGVEVMAKLQVAKANVAALTTQWPEAHPVSGNLALGYSGTRLAVSETSLAINGTNGRLSIDGEIDLASKKVAADLRWSELQWPIGVTEPVVRSGKGKIDVDGSVDEWNVEGNVQVAAVNVEDGEFTIVGGGNRTAAEVAIVDGHALGGSLSGTATYSWIDENAWAAVLDVDGVQIGVLVPEWPATLSGHVAVTGQREPFRLGVDLRSLEGELSDKLVHANGQLEFASNLFAADDFAFEHGDTHIRVDGDLYGEAGIGFDVNIDDIGDYVAGAAGNLRAIGELSLQNEFPSLNIDASSDWLSFSGFEAFELTIKDNIESADGLDFSLSAKDVAIAGEHFRDLKAETALLQEKQSLVLGLSYREAGLSLGLSGALDDWNDPTEWKGQLDHLSVIVRDLPSVHLQSPTNLLLDTDRVMIDEFCLAESTGATLCASAEWVAEELLDFEASFGSVPIELINAFQETGFAFDQFLDGGIAWRRAINEQPTGNADMSITPGTITSEERPDIVVRTDAGSIRFNVLGGALLSGSVNLPMPGTGNITGEFSATDVAAGMASPVEGAIDVSMNDIAVAAALSPLIDKAGGQLVADLDISGLLKEPRFVGSVDLSGGTVSYQPLGLRLEELELQAKLNGDQQLTVDGSFRAGEGVGEIYTSADGRQSGLASAKLRLKGDNLALVNVPDIQATANADLTIDFSKDLLRLGGSLAIPTAHITPTNFGGAAVSESKDVIIIAGELPVDEEETSELQIEGELTVTLGPDVVVDLEIAKANVTGSTTFTWTGSPIPMANGRYDLTGDIQAFGQVLKIEEGGLRFANVLADNPYVRVRATREIFGNSQVKRAGVLVDGYVSRPAVEAYTIPMTTEERALTLLVTGSDFDLEAGAGAIDFGTYIAPKLFVSYGVGVFDRDNVISARYDLKRGFGVKATSGQKDSGVDFIYRYER